MKGTYLALHLALHLGQRGRHPQPRRTLILNASKVDDNTAAEGGGVIADDTGGLGVGSNILVVDFSQAERQHRFRRRRWRHPYHGVMIIRLARMTGETAPADSSGDQGMRIICWFPTEQSVVIALVGFDKKAIADVFYASAAVREAVGGHARVIVQFADGHEVDLDLSALATARGELVLTVHAPCH